MRILTVTHNYPRYQGDPAGAFVARIAMGVAAKGHQVEVLAPHTPGTAETEEVAGVRVHRFRYAPVRLERVAYTGALHQGALRSPLAALGFPSFLLAFGNSVRKAVGELRPDVIHAHWWLPAGWFVSHRKVPYLVTCHGSDVRLLERSRLVRKWAEPVFRRAARVTAVSRFLVEDLTTLLPGSVHDPEVTPMPVDVASFLAGAAQVKASPPRILYAGNLVPSKGVDILLEGAAELSRRGLDYQLKILGQGPSLRALQELARRLGIDTRVSWSPFVPQSQMPWEYGASTITVLPTRGSAEGLGLSLVEALLAGSAVVGTRAGGIPEVVRHEETGLLVNEDPLDLANQLQRLLLDPSLRTRLIGAGKEHVLRTYSPESAIGRFLELYHAAAEHRSQR